MSERQGSVAAPIPPQQVRTLAAEADVSISDIEVAPELNTDPESESGVTTVVENRRPTSGLGTPRASTPGTPTVARSLTPRPSSHHDASGSTAMSSGGVNRGVDGVRAHSVGGNVATNVYTSGVSAGSQGSGSTAVPMALDRQRAKRGQRGSHSPRAHSVVPPGTQTKRSLVADPNSAAPVVTRGRTVATPPITPEHQKSLEESREFFSEMFRVQQVDKDKLTRELDVARTRADHYCRASVWRNFRTLFSLLNNNLPRHANQKGCMTEGSMNWREW